MSTGPIVSEFHYLKAEEKMMVLAAERKHSQV